MWLLGAHMTYVSGVEMKNVRNDVWVCWSIRFFSYTNVSAFPHISVRNIQLWSPFIHPWLNDYRAKRFELYILFLVWFLFWVNYFFLWNNGNFELIMGVSLWNVCFLRPGLSIKALVPQRFDSVANVANLNSCKFVSWLWPL